MQETIVRYLGRVLFLLGVVLFFVSFGPLGASLIFLAYFPDSFVYGLGLLLLSLPLIGVGRLLQWLLHDRWPEWKLHPSKKQSNDGDSEE